MVSEAVRRLVVAIEAAKKAGSYIASADPQPTGTIPSPLENPGTALDGQRHRENASGVVSYGRAAAKRRSAHHHRAETPAIGDARP